ncbi:alpha/beta hydrolase [Amorphus sp. MBR-141]
MPHRRWRSIRRLIVLILVLFGLFWGTGWLYDFNAERTHRHFNDFGADGVIVKARERVLERGSRRLVVLVHGFGASPMTMEPFYDAFAENTEADLWAPLLDYHGRTLERFAAFDADAIRDNLSERLTRRMERYDEVVIIAHSFGGAMVADLIQAGTIPDSAVVILLAPAIDIRANTRLLGLELKAYRLWADYCDFVEIGCKVPNPVGVDAAGVEDIYAQNIFFTIVPDAVLQLFDYADRVAPRVGGIARPVDIVMAKDDGEVDFAGTQAICARLAACRLYAFETGGHLPQFGANAAAVTALFVRLADDPAAGCDGLPCTVTPQTDARRAPAALPGRQATAARETARWN